ncbi:pilus assembly protein [Ideonella margarita]|uniref:PilC/PilY family type IV pilus protein n=1 Tax=Ideonella margarita TaxID=2984191 RepID=A0ABU9C3P9_9BURK
MFTLDDSGSMLADFMPEGPFPVNGAAVTLNGTAPCGPSCTRYWLAGFPADPRKLGRGPAGYLDGVVSAAKHVTADDDAIFQRQFRSPDVNALFYNPDRRYLPWVTGSGGARRPAFSADKAPWDVANASAVFNLTGTLVIDATWCAASHLCSAGTQLFSPGLVYRLQAGADPTLANAYRRFDVNVDGEHAPVVKAPGRADCLASRCTQAEERQNFANWFTYHRTREALTKAALSEALVQYQGRLRLGWSQMNGSQGLLQPGAVAQQPVLPLTSDHLGRVLAGLQAVQSWPTTPMRSAVEAVGQYFRQTGTNSAWLNDDGDASAPAAGCRRSANVILTDGYYNDFYVGAGDVDGKDGPDHALSNPGGWRQTRYLARRPYLDSAPALADTLADVVMRDFVEDLQPGLPNLLRPGGSDIAFWQHLNTFAIGLGVQGTLPAATDEQRRDTLRRLAQGALNWPDPRQNTAARIDDLWHAAVNTAGDFHPATTAEGLSAALDSVLLRASTPAQVMSSQVAYSAGAGADLSWVQAMFEPGRWSGDVRLVDAAALQGNAPDVPPKWSAADQLRCSLQATGETQRRVFTWHTRRGTGVAFNWHDLDDLARAYLGSASVVSLVRGGGVPPELAAGWRSLQAQPIGGVVNAPPLVINQAVDMGYQALSDRAAAAAYPVYLAERAASSASGSVGFGSNDGMFHLVNGATGDEVMAYVPAGAWPWLSGWLSTAYGTEAQPHHLGVDGPLTEAQAWLSGRWETLVLGSMGGGGRSVFGLKLPSNGNPPTANQVVFDLSNDPDLGHVTTPVRVGHVQGAGWFAFFGNGAASPGGQAALLAVNLERPAEVHRLVVPGGQGNGLMGVQLLRDTAGEVIAIYAGDLEGQLWRFDLAAGGPTRWRVGLEGRPLFQSAGVSQSITAAPVLVPHTGGGRMVVFGSGRLITATDALDTSLQSLYGVWDPTPDQALTGPPASPGSSGPFQPRTRSNLQVQQLGGPELMSGQVYRRVSSQAVDWTRQAGWVLDLEGLPGWRLLHTPQRVLSKVLLNVVRPGQVALPCESRPAEGMAFLLSVSTGGAPQAPALDTNGDGLVNATDVSGVAAVVSSVDGWGLLQSESVRVGEGDARTAERRPPDSGGVCAPGFHLVRRVSPGGAVTPLCIPCEGQCGGEVRRIVDRVWRPLLQPPQPR